MPESINAGYFKTLIPKSSTPVRNSPIILSVRILDESTGRHRWIVQHL